MPPWGDQIALVDGLPSGLGYLVAGVLIAWTMSMFGVILSKAGRSPIWAMLVFLPLGAGVLAWWMALARWPVRTRRAD
jgi:hypothetical protein